MRRSARLLKIHRVTVARKLRFLSLDARRMHEKSIAVFQTQKISHIQFDDLETLEHSKCKPLSVSLAVDEKSRKILAFEVSRMPAKGHLATIARRKYGKRRDERQSGLKKLFCSLPPLTGTELLLTSDQNPLYPRFVQRIFPLAKHCRVQGRRGCVAGQGELKKIGFDPLFSLNHTCAMLRANVNRLFRRTWCTTKKLEALVDHLWLYVAYHNTELT